MNLFGGGFKKSCIISMKDFPNGYYLFLFNLQSQTSGDLYSREKHGNVSVKVKFAKPLQENVTAVVKLVYKDRPREVLKTVFRRGQSLCEAFV